MLTSRLREPSLTCGISPVGAAYRSPWREPWGKRRSRIHKPRRGGICRPYGAFDTSLRISTHGSRRGLRYAAPNGASELAAPRMEDTP